MDEIISSYPLEQAIEDGILVKVFTHDLEKFAAKYTSGKPVVATSHLFQDVGISYITDIWNKYVTWRLEVMPTLPEEDKMFVTEWKGKKVWVIEDDTAITMMYPEDY